MSDHAKYSPSQLHRIIACPGSVNMCKDEPNDTSSYAEEGTMLHKVMEKSLIQSPYYNLEVPPSLVEQYKLDREQLRACEDAFSYFSEVFIEVCVEPNVQVQLETKTSLAYLNLKDCYGTADVKISTDNSLHIIDWKFGRGIEVIVKDNPQFMAYALGAVKSVDELRSYDRIVTHVVQPRINNMYEYSYKPEELLLWCEETLRPALEQAETVGPCNPGLTQCQWCLAKYKCRARFELAQNTAEKVFAMYKKSTVDNEELAALLADAKFLEKYIKELKVYALDQCVKGEKMPGYKVVCGRTSRSWKDEKAAQAYLLARCDDGDYELEDLFVSKFLTPPAAEKLTKAMKKDEEFQALIYKSPGKPTLTHESDPRKEYAINAETTFKEYV